MRARRNICCLWALYEASNLPAVLIGERISERSKCDLFAALPKSERGTAVKSLVLEKLPEDNYTVLKFIIHFLGKVGFIASVGCV